LDAIGLGLYLIGCVNAYMDTAFLFHRSKLFQFMTVIFWPAFTLYYTIDALWDGLRGTHKR